MTCICTEMFNLWVMPLYRHNVMYTTQFSVILQDTPDVYNV